MRYVLLYAVGDIAPGSPRVMQRSNRLRSVVQSAPRPFAPPPRKIGCLYSSAARRCASAVSAGTRPSGGSTTSDDRFVVTFLPRSHQNSLYALDTSPSVPLARPL